MATSAPAPATYIVELAQYLEREAGRLDAARVDLRRDVEATRGRWEGLVAERFRSHVDGKHRQRHIDLAHDRLREVTGQLRQAAARPGIGSGRKHGRGGGPVTDAPSIEAPGADAETPGPLVVSVDELRAICRVTDAVLPAFVTDDDAKIEAVDIAALRGLAARGWWPSPTTRTSGSPTTCLRRWPPPVTHASSWRSMRTRASRVARGRRSAATPSPPSWPNTDPGWSPSRCSRRAWPRSWPSAVGSARGGPTWSTSASPFREQPTRRWATRSTKG